MLRKRLTRCMTIFLMIAVLSGAMPATAMAETAAAVVDALTVSDEEVAVMKADMEAILMKYLGTTEMSEAEIQTVVAEMTEDVRYDAMDEAFTFYDDVYDKAMQCTEEQRASAEPGATTFMNFCYELQGYSGVSLYAADKGGYVADNIYASISDSYENATVSNGNVTASAKSTKSGGGCGSSEKITKKTFTIIDATKETVKPRKTTRSKVKKDVEQSSVNE